MRSLAALMAVALALGSTGGPARPVQLTKSEAAAAVAAIDKSREQARTWLRSSPESYLAAVARRDFGSQAALTVGSAADNDLQVDRPGVTPHHLRVTVEGERFRVEAVDAAAQFTVNGNAVRRATIPPSPVGIGRMSLRLSHQGFPAIIVLDPESPHFKQYKGLRHFPVDLAYRFELPLTPNPKPEEVIVMSTRGNQRRALRAGWFDFVVGEKPWRLEAVRLLEPGVGDATLSVFFRDATSGKETYPLGRYVDAARLPDGRYRLDFNAAYNPACAFSDHYNCPVPSRANHLAVAIRAGEMTPPK